MTITHTEAQGFLLGNERWIVKVKRFRESNTDLISLEASMLTTIQ